MMILNEKDTQSHNQLNCIFSINTAYIYFKIKHYVLMQFNSIMIIFIIIYITDISDIKCNIKFYYNFLFKTI